MRPSSQSEGMVQVLLDLMPFIIGGLATGAVYGLAGTGLVLTYKTSGIFNFGYGALATIAAYVFYFIHVEYEVNWILAAIVSVLVVGPIMGLAMEPLARLLAPQPLTYKVVGTVGLLVAVQGIGTLLKGPATIPVQPFIPNASNTVDIFGANVSISQIVLAASSLLLTMALYCIFRFTRLGTRMRAVVDDPDLLAIEGTNPATVRRIAWITGSTIAAFSGVLLLPSLGLDPNILNLLILQVFGAAAVGAFSSIPLTFIGGLAIGVGASVTSKYTVEVQWLTGLPAGLPFLLLFVVLLVLPKRKLVRAGTFERRPQNNYAGPPFSRALAGVVTIALLAIVPLFVTTQLTYFTTALSVMIVLLSLGLLVKTSGQVSLCHAAFMAIGACAFSQFSVDMGLPWFYALLLGSLIVVPVGVIIAIPAIRLSGLFLALATFGFGVLVEQFFYPLPVFFGTDGVGLTAPRPGFAETDKQFYYLTLAALIFASLVIIAIHRGRLGRLLRGLAESPVAVSTFGLNLNTTRILVFSISTFLAAFGGIFYATTFGYASPNDFHFSYSFSQFLLLILMLSPFREPWYVVPSAIGVALPAFWTADESQYWLNAITGIIAILVAVQGGPPVMPNKWRGPLTRAFTLRRAEPLMTPVIATRDMSERAHESQVPTSGNGGLQVTDLVVTFGGLVAVDHFSMTAPLGQVTGVIGPNGAGKTTTFNACSGLVRPTSGRITLGANDLRSMSPSARARHGLGRTFQRMELCDALSVRDNVALGRESGEAGSNPLRQIFTSRGSRAATLEAANQAMELCGISHLATAVAGELSTGQRRLVELARCLAGNFEVLLLDEPSSGLDARETEHFGDLLKQVVREQGCGIILVEHDVNLVMDVSSRIYVLDFGKLLFEGTPAEVSASDEVRAAYLGRSDSDDTLITEAGAALT